ncbi:MAG: Eco57I restriction-modification methylase domain-containing protein [Myxococcota bacterium]
MSSEEIQFEGAREAADVAWRELCPMADSFPGEQVRRHLHGVVDEGTLDRFLEAVGTFGEGHRSRGSAAITAALSDELRRDQGIYLTPVQLADALAAPASGLARGEVCLDLSCGDGALLIAAARRNEGVRVVGVEKQPALAIAAAAHLVALRREQGIECRDRIVVGDGLAKRVELEALEGAAGLVMGNPPYVREKGNREHFRRLRARHEHLEAFWGGRMDLQYLFLHRSLDYLKPGGWMAFLTSSYWLAATNARALRQDLADRAAPRVLLDIRGAGVFEDAPGHHTLLTYLKGEEFTGDVLTRAIDSVDEFEVTDIERAVSSDGSIDGWSRVAARSFTDANWAPFVDAETRSWGASWAESGTALADILEDRQGFVSGADRVNAWNEKKLEEPVERDTPIFLFERDTPSGFGRRQGTVLRPVIRGSSIRANEVLVAPPAETFGLYLDEEVSGPAEAAVEAHLQRFRGILGARREARSGAMPWYRLHWPRARDEQTRPKLVVPRRSRQPRFALDISGSCVSSDCTYLLAPEDAADPLRYLAVAMVLLNRAETARYLREFGKTKGEMLEFYSEPLRRLPLPVRRVEGSLKLNRDVLGRTRAAVIDAEIREVLARLAD